MKERIITISLLAFLLFSCANIKKSAEGGEGRAQQVTAIEARIVERPEVIEGFGPLSYVKKNDVTSIHDAEIARLLFREGDTITAGTLLAVLNNPQITLAAEKAKNEYTQAQAAHELARIKLLEGEFNAEAELLNIEKAEADLKEKEKFLDEQKRKYEKQRVLFEAGGIHEEAIRGAGFEIEAQTQQLQLSRMDLEIRKIGFREQDLAAAGIRLSADKTSADKNIRRKELVAFTTSTLRVELRAAKTNLEIASKNLTSAKTACAALNIKSAQDGIIAARYFEEGERVKKDDKLFTVLNSGALYAALSVREADAFRIEKGMSAAVVVESTRSSYQGIVDLVSPVADSRSFMFDVRVLLPETVFMLPETAFPELNPAKPGMFAQVAIHTGASTKAVVIPHDAVTGKEGNEGIVFVVQGQNAVKRDVLLGSRIPGDGKGG
jgi:RND family efflux transporter MFP subunit